MRKGLSCALKSTYEARNQPQNGGCFARQWMPNSGLGIFQSLNALRGTHRGGEVPGGAGGSGVLPPFSNGVMRRIVKR